MKDKDKPKLKVPKLSKMAKRLSAPDTFIGRDSKNRLIPEPPDLKLIRNDDKPTK